MMKSGEGQAYEAIRKTTPEIYDIRTGPSRRHATASWAYLFRSIKLLSSSSSSTAGNGVRVSSADWLRPALRDSVLVPSR